MERRLVLRRTRQNRNSLAFLAAGLAQAGALEGWRLSFADSDDELRPEDEAVGFSFMTMDLPAIARELPRARRRAPRALFLAGGPHASADPEGTLALGFDVVFVGEGERSLGGWLLDWDRRRAGETEVVQPQRHDLDGSLHVDPGRGLFPFAEISRGCPHACAFCQVPVLFGRRMRHRPAPVVARGIAAAARAGYRRFRFLTPDAFTYRSQGQRVADSLCDLVDRCRKAGASEVMLGTFPSEVRPDRVSHELLSVLDERCTNRSLVLGAQSGSDRVLSLMNRGHGVEENRQAVAWTREHGLLPHVDLLFGFPGETAEERDETLRFARWCLERCGARLHAHVFLPLPGTPVWPLPPEPLEASLVEELARLQRAGVLDGDWSRQACQGRDILRYREQGLIRA